MLPSVTFAINASVNSGMGFSPFEILYGQRPHFPLSPLGLPSDMTSVPADMVSYIKSQESKLDTIRKEMKAITTKSKEKMVEKANERVNELKLAKGDYVYLHSEPTGRGQKLQNKYTGP